jgi:hypothetical protein
VGGAISEIDQTEGALLRLQLTESGVEEERLFWFTTLARVAVLSNWYRARPPPKLVPALIDHLHVSDPLLREDVIYGLVNLRARSALGALRALLDDPDKSLPAVEEAIGMLER